MKKQFAVAMTAALGMLAASTGTAAAQDEITFDGTIWFDRNSNGTADAGEPGAAWVPAVRVVDTTTGLEVANVYANYFGRYSVTVPAGPEYRVESTGQRGYVVTTEPVVLRNQSSTIDFGLRGGTITGQAYADLNANGVKDSGEPAVKAGKLDGYDIVQDADGRFTVPDGWRGQHRLEPADNRANGYALIGQTGDRFVTIEDTDRPVHVDIRYSKPAGNLAVEGFTWTPWQITWKVGDVVDASFTIANHGEVVEQPTFWVGTWADKILSHSDNFVRSGDVYVLKDPLQPGQSAKIEIRAQFDKVGYMAMNVRVPVSAAGEADTDNNSYVGPIVIKEA